MPLLKFIRVRNNFIIKAIQTVNQTKNKLLKSFDEITDDGTFKVLAGTKNHERQIEYFKTLKT